MLLHVWFWIALGVLVLVGIRRVFLGYPAAHVGAKALAARELATVRTAARVIFPEGGAIPASGDSARVAQHSDRFVHAQNPSNQLLMHLLFFAIEHGTILFPPPGRSRFRRFSDLREDQQLAYLESWRQSERPERRLVFTSLRAIVTMGYFADPNVLRALNLSPREIESPVIQADLLWPAVGQHPQDIRFGPEDVATGERAGPLLPGSPVHPEYR